MRLVLVCGFAAMVSACGMGQTVSDEMVAAAETVRTSDDYTALYFEGAFAFTEDGILRTLPAGDVQDETESYSGNGLEYVATRSSDYVVIGGRYNGERITSVSDTYTPVRMNGQASFSGQATILNRGQYSYEPVDLIADFSASDPYLMNDGGNLDVYGAISSNGRVDGSVAYGGTEARMRGGFFGDRMNVGAEKFVAGFAGGTMTGIIVVEQ